MKNHSLRTYLISLAVLLVLVFGFIGVFLFTKNVSASDRPLHKGYFFNETFNSTGNQVLWSGVPSSVNNKPEFIAFIKDLYNNSPHTQEGNTNWVGAAYIIQTMRGADENGNWDHGFPSDTDVDDWEKRINDPLVTVDWSGFYSESINTRTSLVESRSQKDVYKYNSSGDPEAIIFKSGGNEKYAVKRACGNPLGNLAGLPPSGDNGTKKSWNLVPTITVDLPTHNVGDVVTWTHTVTNTTDNAIDFDVDYKYHNNAQLGGGEAGRVTLPGSTQADLLKNKGSVSHDSTYKVQQSDMDTYLCRETWVKPSSSDFKHTTVWTPSPQVCTQIGHPTGPPPPEIPASECRPIKVDVKMRVHKYTYNSVEYQDNVGVAVSTTLPKDLGTYSVDTQLDETLDHTTGDKYTVNYQEINGHIESKYDITHLEPVYDVNGNWLYDNIVYDYTQTDYGPAEQWQSEIGPCYDFQLTANSGASLGGVFESGLTIGATPSVINVSYWKDEYPTVTKTRSTQWQFNKLIYNPSSNVPSLDNANSSSSPCEYYASSSCEPIDSGSAIFDKSGGFLSGSAPVYKDTFIDVFPAGTKVCLVFSVQPRAGWDKNNEDPQWTHSSIDLNTNCIIIAKKPKVQIWGGDLITRTNKGVSRSASPFPDYSVTTSTSDKNGTRFGSWAEYGILAKGNISGSASGAAYAPGGLTYNPMGGNACPYSKLSFTNAGSSTCTGTGIGNYSNASSMPDVAASFQNISSTPLNANLDANTSGVYTTTASSFTINGGNMGKGQWVVINAPNTDITIAGPISYTTDTIISISEIPQVIIIANSITVNHEVANVDAWLIANKNDSSYIATCDEGGKTINECNQKLTVNGPVMTNHLYLRRTFGSESSAPGEPAEVFNLRADAYLWSMSRATSSARMQSIYTTELPPRL
jgi:hypothetical protein